jgi:iron-sulfur cluster repair protein YtfE (RIC family)
MLEGREEQAMTQIPIQADQTVGDVAHHHARTLDVMQRMGINHCCGAQLTLAEAAAAAGVPLQSLLEALNRTQTASA